MVAMAGGADLGGLQAGHTALDKQEGEATSSLAASPYGDSEKICIYTIRDPLLLTVDDEMAAIRGLLCCALEVCNIGAGVRL